MIRFIQRNLTMTYLFAVVAGGLALTVTPSVARADDGQGCTLKCASCTCNASTGTCDCKDCTVTCAT